MQNLLQGLENAREIIASGPVVMRALDEKLKGLTPEQVMMALVNLRFTVTRPVPNSNSRRSGQSFTFINSRSVSRGTFI